MASESRQARKGRTERSRRMSFIARHPAMTTDRCDVGQANRIDVLPDKVLLEIIDYTIRVMDTPLGEDKTSIEAWQSLVHVCQRWRGLVLESRRRLNLRLYCTPETPARDKLDVWPALPLIVGGDMLSSGAGNVVAALRQANRVCVAAPSCSRR